MWLNTNSAGNNKFSPKFWYFSHVAICCHLLALERIIFFFWANLERIIYSIKFLQMVAIYERDGSISNMSNHCTFNVSLSKSQSVARKWSGMAALWIVIISLSLLNAIYILQPSPLYIHCFFLSQIMPINCKTLCSAPNTLCTIFTIYQKLQFPNYFPIHNILKNTLISCQILQMNTYIYACTHC